MEPQINADKRRWMNHDVIMIMAVSKYKNLS